MKVPGYSCLLVFAAFSASQSLAQNPDPPLAMAADDPALQWGACPPILPAGCQIAVLHGNPGAPNADVFLRVPAGYVIPPHRHSSAERMVLVSGRLRFRYQGSAERTLLVGHYAYGPPGVPHRATCEGQDPCTLFIAFVGPVDAEAVTEPTD